MSPEEPKSMASIMRPKFKFKFKFKVILLLIIATLETRQETLGFRLSNEHETRLRALGPRLYNETLLRALGSRIYLENCYEDFEYEYYTSPQNHDLLIYFFVLSLLINDYYTFFTLLIFSCSHFASAQDNNLDTASLIRQATSINPGKEVYLIEDYLLFDVEIQLTDLEAHLDELKFKLGNLQYSSDFEAVKPRIIVATTKEADYYGNLRDKIVKLTIFNRVLSIADGSNLCQKLNLPQIGLENLPQSCDDTLILNFEIRIENRKFLCSSLDKVIRDDACVSYLLMWTNSRQFPHTKSELTNMLNEYKNTKLYLSASRAKFFFTSSPYGTTGCVGQHNIKYSSNLQSLHSQYYFTLGGLYLSIFENLAHSTSLLSESVHTLAEESYQLPTTITTPEMLISSVIENLPVYLLNTENPLGQFPLFEALFKTEVENTHDDIIFQFRDRAFLSTLQSRQLKKVYAAVEQFNKDLRMRVSRFLQNFADRNFYKSLPNTLLFVRNQNPSTFTSLIKSLVPISDAHIIHETFVIIQNCKVKLLHELKKFQAKNLDAKFISYRISQEKKVSSTPPSVKLDAKNRYDLKHLTSPGPILSDEYVHSDLNSLYVDPNLGHEALVAERNLFSSTTVPTTSTVVPTSSIFPTIRINNLNSESSNLPFSSTVDPEVIPGPDPSRHDRNYLLNDPGPDPNRNDRNILNNANLSRQRRSGFFTSVFGLATSDDIVSLYHDELDMKNREDKIEQRVKELSDTNNKLFKSLKTLGDDFQQTLLNEKHIFKTLEEITKAEASANQNLEMLAKSLDRLVIISAEYANLNSQIMLMIHTLEKCHTLILSALIDLVDISKVPIEALNNVLNDNLTVSLQSATAEFVYEKSGYFIRYRIPKLSPPFKIYIVNSIPIFYKNFWIKLGVEKTVVTNSVSDYLELSEIEKLCTFRGDHYLCSPSNVVIRHSSTSCALELVQSYSQKSSALDYYPSCKFNNILTSSDSQYSLITRTGLTIASSFEDRLAYVCNNPTDSKTALIPVGVKVFPLVPDCIYETSQLTIYNPPRLVNSEIREERDRELDVAKALSGLDTLLSDIYELHSKNETSVKNLLETLDQEEKTFSVSVDKLKQESLYNENLELDSNFNPTVINLRQPTHRNNIFAGIFWTILFFLVLTTVGCLYKCCPCFCPNLCKGISFGCSGILEACVKCCKRRSPETKFDNETAESKMNFELQTVGEVRPDPYPGEGTPLFKHSATAPIVHNRPRSLVNSNTQMRPLPGVPVSPETKSTFIKYPNLENIYSVDKPDHMWMISRGDLVELLLHSHVPDGQGSSIRVFYDFEEKIVVDAFGTPLRYIKGPDSKTIEDFHFKVGLSLPPMWYRDDNATIRLKANPAIVYSKTADNWINTITKKAIPGFSKPVAMGQFDTYFLTTIISVRLSLSWFSCKSSYSTIVKLLSFLMEMEVNYEDLITLNLVVQPITYIILINPFRYKMLTYPNAGGLMPITLPSWSKTRICFCNDNFLEILRQTEGWEENKIKFRPLRPIRATSDIEEIQFQLSHPRYELVKLSDRHYIISKISKCHSLKLFSLSVLGQSFPQSEAPRSVNMAINSFYRQTRPLRWATVPLNYPLNVMSCDFSCWRNCLAFQQFIVFLFVRK